jgi:hypothetical protein
MYDPLILGGRAAEKLICAVTGMHEREEITIGPRDGRIGLENGAGFHRRKRRNGWDLRGGLQSQSCTRSNLCALPYFSCGSR